MHGWQFRIATTLLIVCFALPLAVFAGGSVFTRLQADDYCLMAAAQQNGVLATMANVYDGWSGRFTATMLTAILGLTGPGGATLLLLASLAVWAVASYGLLHESLKLGCVQLPRMWTVMAALLIVTGTLAALPYVEQVLYWPTGVVAYTLPFALFTLALWLVLRFPQAWWARLGVAVIAFFVAGCSDTLAPLQLVVLGTLVMFLWNREHRTSLTLAFTGGLIGLLVVLVAPGNAVRIESAGATPSIGAALSLLPHVLGIPLNAILVNAPLLIFAAWGLPALLAYTGPRRYMSMGRLTVLTLGVPGLTFALVGTSYVPSLYVLNTVSDPRTWVYANCILFSGTLSFGYVAGLVLARKKKRPALPPRFVISATILLVVGCLINGLWTALDTANSQRAFAEAWDTRDAFLRSQAGSSETVRACSFHGALGLEDLTEDAVHWTNGCIARYYNLTAIVKDDAEPFIP